jgi:hypothetical protein
VLTTLISNWLLRLQPVRAGWLAGLAVVAVLIIAGNIDVRSLIVIWPVMSVVSVVLYSTYSMWSDTGNFILFVLLVLVPPFGVGSAVFDLTSDLAYERAHREEPESY